MTKEEMRSARTDSEDSLPTAAPSPLRGPQGRLEVGEGGMRRASARRAVDRIDVIRGAGIPAVVLQKLVDAYKMPRVRRHTVPIERLCVWPKRSGREERPRYPVVV